MKKNYLIIALSLLCINSYTQQLSQVGFSQGSIFSWFSISTNQNILIRISDDGKILESGTEQQSLINRNVFDQKLLPYLGRVDYYAQQSDSAFRGKVKSIGTCYFTYYPSSEYPEKIGKIKTAGSLSFDYYGSFEDALIAGKIKSIGSNTISYFTSLDNDVLKGKLKMVGRSSINYYSTFDDILIRGKMKSIDSYQYTWYTTYDRKEFAGRLKYGNQRQLINGINYIILW